MTSYKAHAEFLPPKNHRASSPQSLFFFSDGARAVDLAGKPAEIFEALRIPVVNMQLCP
jgi:hypothetical protein